MKEQKINGKRETLLSFFWNMSSKVVAYLLLLVLGNLYIASEYGKAVFVISIYYIIVMVSTLGMPNAAVPWIVKKKDFSSVFKILFVISFLAALGTILITMLVVSYRAYNKDLIYMMIFIALAIILYWANNVSISFLIAKKNYSFISFVGVASVLITLGMAVILKRFFGLGIIISYFSGYLFSAVVMSWRARHDFLRVIRDLKINFSSFKTYIKDGAVVSLVTLSFFFMSWADSVILGLFTNLESVGRYSISITFSNIVILIPFTLSMFVITRISEVKNKIKSQNILKRVMRVSYYFSFIIALLISSYLSLFIKIFFPKYQGVEIYAIILMVGALFYSSYFIVYNYFVAKAKVNRNFLPIVLASLINIFLDIILVFKFGIYGVCAATAIAHFTAFILLTRGFLKARKIVIMSILPFVLLLAYYSSYFGIIIAIAFCIILIKLKIIEIEDLKIIKNAIKK
jgi:O-antigen/teichoic acid export membrane protein